MARRFGRGLRECWLEARAVEEGGMAALAEKGAGRDIRRDSGPTSVLPAPGPVPETPTDVRVIHPVKSGETVGGTCLAGEEALGPSSLGRGSLCDLRLAPHPL